MPVVASGLTRCTAATRFLFLEAVLELSPKARQKAAKRSQWRFDAIRQFALAEFKCLIILLFLPRVALLHGYSLDFTEFQNSFLQLIYYIAASKRPTPQAAGH